MPQVQHQCCRRSINAAGASSMPQVQHQCHRHSVNATGAASMPMAQIDSRLPPMLKLLGQQQSTCMTMALGANGNSVVMLCYSGRWLSKGVATAPAIVNCLTSNN